MGEGGEGEWELRILYIQLLPQSSLFAHFFMLQSQFSGVNLFDLKLSSGTLFQQLAFIEHYL